jgi:hypothetical protein
VELPSTGVSSDAQVVRSWRSVLVNYSFPTVVALFAAGTLVIGVARVPEDSLLGPIVVVGLFSLFAVLAAQQYWLYFKSQTVLTADHIRADYGSISTTVALSSISAVLVARCPQWHIYVMHEDGPPVMLPVPNFVFMWRSQALAPPDSAYWQHVADSPAGLASRLIYELAARAQADDGPLASAPPLGETVAHAGRQLSRASRWWSPTGETFPLAP